MTTKRLQILLIESNEGDTYLIKECLKEVKLFDFSLEVAGSIEKAIAFLKSTSVDIVLVDPIIPNCEEELGEYCKLYPFIILTNIEAKHYKRFFDLGAQDFINKSEVSSIILERSIYFCFERFNNLLELKSYSKALEDSGKKLLQAQTLAQIGNWELDLNTLHVEWSDTVYDIFDRDPNSYKPSFPYFLKSVHPEDREFIKHIFLQAMGSSIEFNIDHRMLKHKKETIYINTHIVSNVERGKIIGTIQDITPRKKAELALIESEDKYQKLFHESMDGIFVCSFDGQFFEFNEATLKMLGYNRLEFKKLDSVEIYADPSFEAKIVEHLRQTGSLRDFELQFQKKDDSLFEGLITTHVWKSEDGTPFGYYAIFRDITEHKKNEELIREKELVEKSSQLKQLFIAKMSHEIRTPLNGIIGMTNLLANTQLDAKQSHFIQAIKSSSDHLMALVSDVLDFSKIERGNLQLEETTFDIHEQIEYLVDSMQLKAKEKDIQIYSIIASDIPNSIKGDKVKLNQVLINLINNAVKFTDEGYIIVDLKLDSISNDNSIISFSVKDTGIGIASAEIDKIFESFTQVSENLEKRKGGAGLGLSISRDLVRLMGGNLLVESQLDKGSTFSFKLEFQLEEEMSQNHNLVSEIDEGYQVNKAKILIAEDNPVNLMVVKENLKSWIENIEIEEAANGKEAYTKSKDTKFDLLILDIQMPIMDGLQVARLIRTNSTNANNKSPILSLTAFADENDKKMCLDAGMDDYVTKPVNTELLKQKVVTLLNNNNNNHSEANKNNAKQLSSFEYLDKVTKDNTELRIKLVKMLNEEIPVAMDNLSQEASRSNWTSVKNISHKLLSSVAFLDSGDIVNRVKQLEKYAEVEPGQVIENIKSLQEDLKVKLLLLNKEMIASNFNKT